MRVNIRWAVAVCVAALALGVAGAASAQVNPRDVPIVAQPQQRFDAGQDIQPIFEGWTPNEDGSFTFHFGYLNRNYREQPHVPVGPNNYFSPGAEDRGQPTYFFPRTQRYQLRVRVPADMGRTLEDALVWTVTHHGSEQKAFGWFQPEWEIDANTITSNNRTGRGRSKDEVYANGAPSVTVAVSRSSVAVGERVTLTVSITDDELPTKLPPRRPRTRLPALIPPDDALKPPDNVRWYRKPSVPRNGLSLLWVVYRGPANATFEPSGYQRAVAEEEPPDQEVDGLVTERVSSRVESTNLEGDGWTAARFETTVTFDEPGTYSLRAWSSDAMLLTPGDVTVTVTGSAGQ